MKSERDEMVKNIDEIKDGIENEFQGNVFSFEPDNIYSEITNFDIKYYMYNSSSPVVL